MYGNPTYMSVSDPHIQKRFRDRKVKMVCMTFGAKDKEKCLGASEGKVIRRMIRADAQ